MERPKWGSGGQPINVDDLSLIELNSHELLNAQFQGLGNFALTGCEITGAQNNANISGGLVRINNKIIRFFGLTGANFLNNPFYYIIEANTTEYRPKTFADGNIKNTRFAVTCTITTTLPSTSEYLTLTYDGTGLVRIKDALLNTFVRRGVIWDVYINLIPGTDIDETGKGINQWKGWAFCNGQNQTPDLQGLVRVGLNQNDASFYPLGKTGGSKEVALTPEQTPLPEHSHNVANTAKFTQNSQNAPYLQGTTQPQWRAFDVGNIQTTNSQDNRTIESHNNMPPYMAVVPMMKL